MQYGIQRRTIYLIPPTPDDVRWLLDQFDRDEVWTMFGFEGPSRALMQKRYESGSLVVGIIHKVATRRRVGFVVCFPPSEPHNAWEFGTAIPDEKDRDAYSAIHAADAITHYMFDHAHIERGMWRVREDNRQSNALARRMGYAPYGGWEIAGHRFNFYRMNREKWDDRYARLDRGEEQSPSGLGETFITLAEPPFDPILPGGEVPKEG